MELTVRGQTTGAGRPALTSEERAALRSFRHAALTSAGYQGHLARHGVDHRQVSRLDEVPYTDKHTVFGDDIEEWLDGGKVSDAAELLTSSGSTGMFSVGVTSRAERRAQERAIDNGLRALGAGEGTSTLLLNCLPMGINVPTRIATVATPSVHLEMGIELLARAGDRFDRVVIASEPLFLKEFGETALRMHGPGFADRVAACFVGGEWVAESWRRYVSELFGFPRNSHERPGVMVSMGAAEAGLHMLTETPLLRALRAACETPSVRTCVFGEDRGYTPTLFTWDPKRVYPEERLHTDGARTLVFTSIGRRLLPLIRYDLDDEAQILDAATINDRLADTGVGLRTDGPVIAVWGRHGTAIRGDGWTLRPEPIKEGLFATAIHAGTLTGRFRLTTDGERPELHVQLRDGVRPAAGLATALAETTQAAAGVPATVHVHSYRDYPFHEAGDFQHKPVYL